MPPTSWNTRPSMPAICMPPTSGMGCRPAQLPWDENEKPFPCLGPPPPFVPVRQNVASTLRRQRIPAICRTQMDAPFGGDIYCGECHPAFISGDCKADGPKKRRTSSGMDAPFAGNFHGVMMENPFGEDIYSGACHPAFIPAKDGMADGPQQRRTSSGEGSSNGGRPRRSVARVKRSLNES